MASATDTEWPPSRREWLKSYLAANGGVYVGPLVAEHAKAAGFVEGVHFHRQQPMPMSPPSLCDDPSCVRGVFCSGKAPNCPGRPRLVKFAVASR